MNRFVDTVIINEKNQVLLLKRDEHVTFMPSKWCLPGGHVEKGFSLLENAKRELEEETGIVAEHLTKVDNYTYRSGAPTTVFYGFLNMIAPDQQLITLVVNEHSEAKWFDVDDIINNEIQGELMPELPNIIEKVFRYRDDIQ